MASAEQKHATGNGTTGNGTAMNDVDQPKDAKDLLPHLESLERIIKLPVVNAAWDKSQDVYGKVKGKCSKGKQKKMKIRPPPGALNSLKSRYFGAPNGTYRE